MWSTPLFSISDTSASYAFLIQVSYVGLIFFLYGFFVKFLGDVKTYYFHFENLEWVRQLNYLCIKSCKDVHFKNYDIFLCRIENLIF